jgi:hypothetical protein
LHAGSRQLFAQCLLRALQFVLRFLHLGFAFVSHQDFTASKKAEAIVKE